MNSCSLKVTVGQEAAVHTGGPLGPSSPPLPGPSRCSLVPCLQAAPLPLPWPPLPHIDGARPLKAWSDWGWHHLEVRVGLVVSGLSGI